MDNNDKVMTVSDVATYLKISKSKIYYLINQRKLPYVRIQRNVRVLESDLILWLDKCKVEESR
jgi:excisionase family DNA binding protein